MWEKLRKQNAPIDSLAFLQGILRILKMIQKQHRRSSCSIVFAKFHLQILYRTSLKRNPLSTSRTRKCTRLNRNFGEASQSNLRRIPKNAELEKKNHLNISFRPLLLSWLSCPWLTPSPATPLPPMATPPLPTATTPPPMVVMAMRSPSTTALSRT